MNVLVILPNWVGDVVMATPAFRALRRHFASDQITYLGRAGSLATLEGTPWADATLLDVAAGGGLRSFWRLMRTLRQRHFDLAVLLPNSFRSALLARLGGAKRVIGYDRDGRGWLLSDRLAPLRDADGYVPVSAIDYYNAIADRLGASVDSRRMELPVTPSDERSAEALLAECGVDPARPIVMVNAGAAFGTSKLWAPARFAAVADALIQRHSAQIIINAAPSERTIAQQVAHAMKHPPAINFASRDNSLGLLKALMRRCRVLVTNDTGARHIAAASGIGVVTIFGSTHPDWTTIYYSKERIIRTTAACAPCQKKMCPNPAGPQYHQCMISIGVEPVLAAAEELLAEAGGMGVSPVRPPAVPAVDASGTEGETPSGRAGRMPTPPASPEAKS